MSDPIIQKESLPATERSVSIKLKANQTVSVTTKQKSQSAFSMVSRQRSVQVVDSFTQQRTWEMQGINLIQELCTMSKAEQRVIAMIESGVSWDKQAECYNYVVAINQLDFDTPTQYKEFSRGYTLLFDRDLVRRVSKGHYMINPSVLLPSKEGETFHRIWNEAKASNKVHTTD